MALVIGKGAMPKMSRPIKTTVKLDSRKTDSFTTSASKKMTPFKGSPKSGRS